MKSISPILILMVWLGVFALDLHQPLLTALVGTEWLAGINPIKQLLLSGLVMLVLAGLLGYLTVALRNLFLSRRDSR